MVHKMRQKSSTHRSLEKALEILLSFAPHSPELSTQELSERLGFHRSTVNRVLHVLEKYGFMQQNPETRRFLLGHSIMDLGLAVQQSLSSNLTKIAIPLVDGLRDQIRETVVLEIAGPTYTAIAYIAEGPGPVRIRENVGARHGYNAAAGAKSILAFSPTEFQERVFAGEMTAYTSKTITDPRRMKRELKEIRSRGFAFDDEERNPGIRAFGCPVFNYENRAVAAVAVAGPAQRIHWERRSEIVPALKKKAAEVSEKLYCSDESATKPAGKRAGRRSHCPHD
ncbi:MAG: IclR family transcriptional regulator [Desulfobacteraceae bacterium]|nr:MAG: IclR family transcriptional regulator [Desulfobacteraceae bacterium]